MLKTVGLNEQKAATNSGGFEVCKKVNYQHFDLSYMGTIDIDKEEFLFVI